MPNPFRQFAKHKVNAARNEVVRSFQEMIDTVNKLDIPDKARKFTIELIEEIKAKFQKPTVQQLLDNPWDLEANGGQYTTKTLLIIINIELIHNGHQTHARNVTKALENSQEKLYEHFGKLTLAVNKAEKYAHPQEPPKPVEDQYLQGEERDEPPSP